MMLVPKQGRFSLALADLIQTANNVKILVTIGEVYRTEFQAHEYVLEGKGIEDSCHLYKLAADIFLFDNEIFEELPEDSYQSLATYWIGKSTDEDKRCWGGNFKRKDIYHFSFEFQGRQ